MVLKCLFLSIVFYTVGRADQSDEPSTRPKSREELSRNRRKSRGGGVAGEVESVASHKCDPAARSTTTKEKSDSGKHFVVSSSTFGKFRNTLP